MTKQKEITGVLYFSDHEPRVMGHLQIGNVHFEIVGVRRSQTRADIRAHKMPNAQGDFFEGEAHDE